MVFLSFDAFIDNYRGYDKAPVVKEILFDTETPISLAERFYSSDYLMLLESIEGGEKWARYSFFGKDPGTIYRIKANSVEVTKGGSVSTFDHDDPLSYIKEMIKGVKYPNTEGLPRFCTGFVGYFSYDSIRYTENIPDENIDDLKVPDILLMQFDEVFAFDHLKHSLMIIVNADLHEKDIEGEYKRAVERINKLESELLTEKAAGLKAAENDLSKIEIDVSKEQFMSMVGRAREYIHEGDIFQVVLSQRLRTRVRTHPFNIYRMLRNINPSPYMFYLKMKDFSLVGASPEMIVRILDDTVETCPIAGTRKRGSNQAEDKRIEEELLCDEKETSEHMMLVDLGRNDIGRISEVGSVKVENLMHIERFSHVMHMVTNVKGTLKKEYSPIDALMSVLPAGTLSGAPKIRAMEIIDELETIKRGPYGGATGYFSYNGNTDFCITIRTVVIKDDMAYIQSGAGIVADSDPGREYEESIAKAKAMLSSIERAVKSYDTPDR